MTVQKRQDGVGVRRTATRRASKGTANTPDTTNPLDQSTGLPQARVPGPSRHRPEPGVAGSGQSPSSRRRSKAQTPSEPEAEQAEQAEQAEDQDQDTDELELIDDDEAAAYRASRRKKKPDSGVVVPLANGNASASGAPDGMHTMDGRPAEPQVIDQVIDPETGLPPIPRKYRRNLDAKEIYRGRARLALIRDLAMGEWSDASIAQSIGVPMDVVVDFRLTFEMEIQEVSAALAGQLAIESAGMWISKRQNRIAELQEDYEDIDLVLGVMRENTKASFLRDIDGSDNMARGDALDANLLLGSRRHQNLLRSKIAILKAVADELSPRNKDAGEKDESNQIRYVIEQDGDSDDILGSLT